MSAWIVEKEHIDVLLKLALEGPADNDGDIRYMNGTRWDDFTWYHGDERHTLTRGNADEVGDMLVRECVRSVSYRYPHEGREDWDALPGAAEYYSKPYRYTDPGFQPTIGEGVKTIGCYEYQSCEHPEWEASSAHAFCKALEGGIVWKLPGLAAAPWGWGPGDVAARREAVAS